MKRILWVILIIAAITACSKKVPLDKDQFTSLLIDMHTTDGMLSVARGDIRTEKDNYLYYNDLFEKYGITREDFDSCVTYYSLQSALFNKIYDVVIDTLSRRQTKIMREWKELTVNDTVNLFPGYTMIVADTIRPDSTQAKVRKKDSIVYETRVVKADTVYFDKRNQFVLVKLDSIVPGMYKFTSTIKLEKSDRGKRNFIQTYFLSADNDTLKVPDQYVGVDTLRPYKKDWEFYVADSSYTKLFMKIPKSDRDTRVKVKKLNDREGCVYKTEIFKTYVAPNREKQLKKEYEQRRQMELERKSVKKK
ncbi:DUF4296 domain-containing protein [Butyricimonas paravirosa]|jgi:hypothetical protein|uniref:DUF4296 domain-containing protein n=1 Tax=Butyricimonas TaxID=574697 RepID=UPI002A7FF30F|nr:DUF4296 domain-containing protein [Butyricimonas paravirosa]